MFTLMRRYRKGLRWLFGPHDFPSVLAAWALLLTPVYLALRRRALLRAGLPGGE